MKNNKRLLSLIMALAISVSAFTAFKPGIKAAADESGITPPYSIDTELFSWDVSSNGQTLFNGTNSANKFGYVGELDAVNANNEATGTTDTKAVNFSYYQASFGYASLPIGYKYLYDRMWIRSDSYSWNGAYDSNMKLQAGVTYEVTYDYKNQGTVKQPLTIGLAMGYVTYLDGDEQTYQDNFRSVKADKTMAVFNKQYKPNFKIESKIEEYDKNTALTQSDWTQQKAYITIPAGTEIEEKDRLYITFKGGGTGADKPYYYVDNIKVTALAPDYLFKYNTNGGTAAGGSEYTPYSFYTVESGGFTLPENPVNGDFGFGGWYTDEALTVPFNADDYKNANNSYVTVNLYAKWNDKLLVENDYEDGTVRDTYTSNTFEYSGNLATVVKSPFNGDGHGLVIDYAQANTIFASLVLGYDYVYQFINEHPEKYRVTPEAGKTYKVQYDYRITGTVNGILKLGLAAGYAEYNKTSTDPKLNWNYKVKNYVAETTDIIASLGKEYGNGEWKTNTAYITVPEDAVMPQVSRLYITFNGGNTGDDKPHIYIDNVKVYETKNNVMCKASNYFQDGMMFQRNKPMTVWGTSAAAGRTVKAELIDKDGTVIETQTVTVGDNLNWKLSFTAQKGSYDTYTIKLYDNGIGFKTISDILIGELWLAAGQSNMEYTVEEVSSEEIESYKTNNNIRFFKYASKETTLTAAEKTESDGYWRYSTASGMKTASAVAYSMCQTMQAELKVPVGFIDVSWGGTPIETWLSKAAIDGDSDVKAYLEKENLYFEKLTDEVRDPNTTSFNNTNYRVMSMLYNNRIAPLTNANIAGMIWYQGEDNIMYEANHGEGYDKELELLVTSYSKAFGFDNDMPFALAHLAPFRYGYNADLRLASFTEKLTDAVKALEGKANVMQITIYDQPLTYDSAKADNNNAISIHPSKKLKIGERFATVIYNKVYAEAKNDYSAPVYTKAEADGQRMIVTFKNTGTGLKALNGKALNGFKIAGSDGVFVNAKASIIGKDQVAVWSLGVKDPKAVTYAWDGFNMTANLANSEGVPAAPFRTDRTETNKYQLLNDWLNLTNDKVWGYPQDNTDLKEADAWNSSTATLTFGAGIFGNTLNVKSGESNASFKPNQMPRSSAEALNLSGVTSVSLTVKNNLTEDAVLKAVISSGGKPYYLACVDNVNTKVPGGSGYSLYRYNTNELWYNDGNAWVSTTECADILENATSIYFTLGEGADITISDITVATSPIDSITLTGDANADGTLDIRDLVKAKAENGYDISADLDGDGKLEEGEKANIRKALLGF